MPRYYFDATGGGRTLLDHEGDEFADASAAIAYGSQTAAQCCADRLARGFYPSDEGMRVRDSDGEVLARFTYRDALVSLLQDRLTN